MTNIEYKKMLIEDILEWQTRNQFTREILEKKSIRSLEIIHDNVKQAVAATYEDVTQDNQIKEQLERIKLQFSTVGSYESYG